MSWGSTVYNQARRLVAQYVFVIAYAIAWLAMVKEAENFLLACCVVTHGMVGIKEDKRGQAGDD